MNNSINLVKTEDRENSKRKKTTYILKIISIVFVSFVVLVSIVLFILSARFSLSSVKNEEAATLESITHQKNKLSKFYLLNDRLKGIEEILKNRKNYTNSLNTLMGQIPAGATASSLQVDKGNITLTVNASSLFPINKFLNDVINLSINKHIIRDMTIESLTIDSKTGTYSLSIKGKL